MMKENEWPVRKIVFGEVITRYQRKIVDIKALDSILFV